MTQEWALATTMPNAEMRVSERLDKIDLPHYLFLRRFRVAHRGQLVERLKPAFPSYIIVPMATCWDLVRHVSGVIGVVAFGSQPAAVRPAVIEGLVAACGGGKVLPLEEPEKQFKFGDEVVVDSVVDMVGTFQYSLGDDRAVVLVEWLGRSVFVNVKECELRKKSELVAKPSDRRRQHQRSRRASRTRASSRDHVH